MAKINWLTFYLLNVDRMLVSRLRPTTTLDTYVGATNEFHDDGLYSTLTFGPVGSEVRDEKFSYIDLGIEIISPVIAMTLFELKRLYKDIMSGKRYATWNDEIKDFEPANPGDAEADTGYTFFLKHYKELTPKATGSLIRQDSVDVFNKFRDIALSQYVLVMPAGLRDLVVKDGRPQEDEINKYYRKLIATSRAIPKGSSKNSPLTDNVRWKLQNFFIEIYKYVFNIFDGKKGYMRGKVAARALQNGTRNVLSSMDASSEVMGRADALRPTDTLMGLFQGLKSILPVAIHAIRSKYLPEIDAGNGHLYLINPKTLKRERVLVNSESYDKFTTDEGIEKLINSQRHMTDRHSPVKVDGMYVALIYIKKDKFRVFFDISQLPDGFDKKDVYPISYTELLYLSGYDKWNDYFSVITRYPVAGQGSTYSSTMRVTTTARTSMKYELAEDWEHTFEKPAIDFPDRSVAEFVSSMAPHPSRIKAMVADFDGDTGSADSVYTDEALAENRNMLHTASYWVTGDSKPTIQIDNDIVNRTLHNLLGEPRPNPDYE